MKKILTLFALISVLYSTAQDKDLIVKTTLDSMYVTYKKLEAARIHYTIADSATSISVADVFYMYRYGQGRPQYFNQDFDWDAAYFLKTGKMLHAEMPVKRTQRDVQLLEPWRGKSARRLRTAGGFMAVGALGMAAGVFLMGYYPDDPQVGLVTLGASVVMFASSSAFLISAGNAVEGY